MSTTARRWPRPISAAALLVLALLLGACGDDSGTAAGGGGDNVQLAKPKETIGKARDRITKTLASSDCKKINELNPLGRPGLNSAARCAYLRRLADLEVAGADSYGDAGAVIDYRSKTGDYNTILIRDSDGRYHIAFFDPFGAPNSVGTRYAKGFDKAAHRTLEAFEHRDCDAFLAVASRRLGLGRTDEATVCDYVKDNPISRQLEDFPNAEYKSSGGNADYAFYTLATPATHWTLVFARQTDRKGQPKELDLPQGAATYAYVGAYPTGSP